jgi:seryl-tRNA synthetase
MLDIKFIRENKDFVQKVAEAKNRPVDINRLLSVDDERKALVSNIDSAREEQNKTSEKIISLQGAEKENAISLMSKLKSQIKENEEKLKAVVDEWSKLMALVPNVVHDDVPYGKDESGNKVIRSWGEIPKFNFEPKDHVVLGESLDLIDIDTSINISGSRFNYLKNEAALMQIGIIDFVFKTLTNAEIILDLAKKVGADSKTYVPVIPPVFIKSEVAKKMDRFDPIEDRYFLPEDDVLLVGSAEHTLGPMYMDKIVKESDLPLRFIGYSTAFRREAGSYGKDTKGILRRHQFDKLEIESFSTPEDGPKEQDLIVAIQEYLLQKLEIPYQVVMICTGDMGKPDFRQIDIECYMPAQGKYRETHTSDYMTDFQARRLNTRFKRGNTGKTEFVHMNDATAFAIGRILIAIIENYQNEDGSLRVPKVLQSYIGKEIIKPRA